ncbi:ABC transporter ATP-binding protein [Frankia sp. CH37]|nr:ABC transporter ATP-binding protein [Parafrankia sp. CH37]
MGPARPGTSVSAARTQPPLLALRGVEAGYGAITVLHSIDLEVAAGEVLAVLGPNGAGKSTTLRVAAGLHRPSAGDLLLDGRPVTGADPVALARSGLCLIPEGRGIFPTLTVGENLRMVTYRGVSRAEVEHRAFTAFPRLAQRRRQRAGTMSGGEQQMLAMARAIAGDPAVLLLDELSMGLAPRIVGELYDKVHEIAATGVTIVAVEQFAAAVLGVATTAVVMADGRIVLAGAPDDIRGELQGVYLGGPAQPGRPRPGSPPPTADHRNDVLTERA